MSEYIPYFEKLQDPRWQQKRLKVMERDEWQCVACFNAKEKLSVHHLVYCGEPWDSPDEHLETLCETCHTRREEFNNTFERSLLPTRIIMAFIRYNSMLTRYPNNKPKWDNFVRKLELWMSFQTKEVFSKSHDAKDN